MVNHFESQQLDNWRSSFGRILLKICKDGENPRTESRAIKKINLALPDQKIRGPRCVIWLSNDPAISIDYFVCETEHLSGIVSSERTGGRAIDHRLHWIWWAVGSEAPRVIRP